MQGWNEEGFRGKGDTGRLWWSIERRPQSGEKKGRGGKVGFEGNAITSL